MNRNNHSVSYLQLLSRNVKYRNLWIGSVISSFGDWLSYVAVLALVWDVTGSGVILAMTMISRALPYAIAGMIAGVVLDRGNRKKILVICDVLRALFAIGYLFIHSTNWIWLVYVLGGGMQVFTAFFSPGVNAWMPKLVNSDELGTANALRQSTFGVTMVLGSAVGGTIVGLIGRDWAFILNSLSYLLSALFLLRITVPLVMETRKMQSNWDDFKEGFCFLWSHRLLLAIVLRRIGERLGAGFNLLISVFAVGVWHAGEQGIGTLYSILGLGLIIGGVIARRFSDTGNYRLIGVIGYSNLAEGLFWLLFCLAPNLYLGGIFLALMVGSDIVATVTDTTLMQQVVPDHLLGRMFSMRETLLTLSWSLALAITGILIDRYHPQQVGFGISAILVSTGLLWLIAKWRRALNAGQNRFLQQESSRL